MRRSSKMLPLYIIITLIFYIFCLVMLMNYSQYSIKSYDFFGINKLSSYFVLENNGELDESDDFVVENDTANESAANSVSDGTPVMDDTKADTEIAENTVVESSENEADTSVSATKSDIATASSPEQKKEIEKSSIEYSVEYSRTLNKEPDKIEFFTTDENCDYRVWLKSKVSDNPIEGTIELTVYDERGIKISDERTFYPSYGNTSNYKDEFFTDYNLQKSKKHTLKISNSYNVGDYKIVFQKIERDAGVDKSTAKLLTVGEEITATMNSTLDDWYAYELDVGEYELSIHNIDIGAKLDVAALDDNNSHIFSQILDNEDSLYRSISIRNPRKIYIEIENYYEKNVDGTYIMNLTRVDE